MSNHTKGKCLIEGYPPELVPKNNPVYPNSALGAFGINGMVIRVEMPSENLFEQIAIVPHKLKTGLLGGDSESNAELIVEAFNVSNETGMTPRQLADENAKLLKALKNLMSSMGGGKTECGHDFNCTCPWELAKEATGVIKKSV